MNKYRFFAIGWLLLLVVPLNAQEASDEKAEIEKHKIGQYQVEMPGAWATTYLRAANCYESQNLDPEKVRRANNGELQWFKTKEGEGVSYEVYAPESYQPGKPHGVMVYISAGPRGKFTYENLLGDHDLIGVAANKSGNLTGTLFRHTYAVQAVEMIAQRYSIDRDRIYICGTSGGGRVASQVMFMNSDTFTGGIPLIGANPCIPMRNAGSSEGKKPASYYQASGAWKKPNRKLLSQAAEHGRYVFMTGEKDMNRQNVEAVFKGYQKAGFSQVYYIEEPGLKHKNPNPKFFKQALDLLDAPLRKAAESNYKAAQKKQKSKKFGDAMVLYQKAAMHGKDFQWADDAMENALKLRGEYDKALAAAEDAINVSDKKAFKDSVKTLSRQWSTEPAVLKELKKRFTVTAKAASK